MRAHTKQFGGVLWRVLAVAMVIAGIAFYRSLAPIDDPSLAGPEPKTLSDRAQPIYAGANQVYWGDLHIHTSLSSDAFTMGVRALPDDAYRFAKGETLQHGAGFPVTISRPLDFAAVTD
ncbi:MAG: DUF3604 domain-containing protein, partial [Luminiphilus sp.]|nr:DUF3604 domain-containing protein [Luminiphilus sp.]